MSLQLNSTLEQMVRHLRRANQIAIRARKLGHHPFGAILVAPITKQC
ncbi:hypothetical protein [Leptothermofonsia sp. ETS-13]